MRKTLCLILFLMAGCSQQNAPDSAESRETANAVASGVDAVANRSYRYSYALAVPAPRIAEAQEAHARACEALGPSRCVVTGLYLSQDHGAVRGTLDLAVARGEARQFGAGLVASTSRFGGRVREVQIDSQAEDRNLAPPGADVADERAEIAEIERRLATLPATARERQVLNTRLIELREAVRSAVRDAAGQASDARSRLAATPLHLDYGALSTGWFDGDSPLANGYAIGRDSLTALVAVLLLIVAGGLPWALVALALFLALRWVDRRLLRRPRLAAPAPLG